MEERDVALGDRVDRDAGETQTLEQACRIFLVSAESIERFGENALDLLAHRRLHHRLEARAQQRRAGYRRVGVLLHDLPALTLRVLATDSELILNRGVPLVVGRVAGVNGNFHGRRSEHVSSSPYSRSKHSCAACRASNLASARSALSSGASICVAASIDPSTGAGHSGGSPLVDLCRRP